MSSANEGSGAEPLFRLGSFSAAGEPPFPGLVLGEQVHAVQGLRALERELRLHLHGVDSVLGLLDRWDDNLPALRAIARTLGADASIVGTPLAQLRTHAPLVPRQIFQAGANYHKHVIDLIVDGAVARDPSTDRDPVRANAAAMMRKRAETGKPFVFMGLASS
ncbi:MAG: fumarylacetoacetate hydrolase family protein, partial [Steroidobacteraceae bacterium]